MELNVNQMRLWDIALLERVFSEQYRERFRQHCREQMLHQSHALPKYIWMHPSSIIQRRIDIMLNFKNDKGEIVMTENDKGDLSIHDDVLKESLKEHITLEEAKKNVEKKED